MRLALEEADLAAREDEVPVGAVVFAGDELVGRGHNRMRQTGDPTAHAEMLALRDAAETTASSRLEACSVYVTLEPCAMCAGALVLARVGRLVYGAADPKAGACGSLRNVVQDTRLNHRIAVRRGVLQDACGDAIRAFFQRLRK
jgi:tRNA(adenine34) deaminase